MLADHIDGLSFRKISKKYGVSVGTAFNKVHNELEKLPDCADITRQYCNRFCGILLVDGKFVKVGRYSNKIPVVYTIDYDTHDIINYKLTTGENYQTFHTLFSSLRLLNYPLRSFVSEDNINIPKACEMVYPKAHWQLCINHYKENIRKSLSTRTDPKYQPFMYDIQTLFSFKRSEDDFNRVAKNILRKHINDINCVKILLDIEKRKTNLMTYLKVKGTPRTNNLIECFNSHLNGRLKTIKGFQSFKHAKLWLNAYFIKRRLIAFTDCTKKFKHLNGHCSIEKTLKEKRNLEILQSIFR